MKKRHPSGGASVLFCLKLQTLSEEKRSSAWQRIGISIEAMIAGNPKAGRKVAAFAIVLILVIVVSTALIAMRKKTAPLKVVPMHPSTLILSAR
jgi:hypothetical protein